MVLYVPNVVSERNSEEFLTNHAAAIEKASTLDLNESWDPLATESDPGLVVAAQRREIHNILKSYTGYYDLFAELIQNALDAVDRRRRELADKVAYHPEIRININMKQPSVTVVDNGCGMDLQQFRQFMKPNLSFKDGSTNRGSKGVGATFLAYGFNYLAAATTRNNVTHYGVLEGGRTWVDDKTATIPRPKVAPVKAWDSIFDGIEHGSFMQVRLNGPNIRPKDLNWLGANTASQWLSVLRVTTPLGGVYLGEESPKVKIQIHVIDSAGNSSTETLDKPDYIYPHKVLGKAADLREYLEDRNKRAAKNLDVSKIPAKFSQQNGIWGEWSGEDILKDQSPLKPRLDEDEKALISELGLRLYCYVGFSTELWDAFNDAQLKLRKGLRLLRGGLQLATRNMPQGMPIPIPMTNNIGFQNIAHVIVHFDNAEPDLGRKGFQPEHTQLAGKLAVSAVTAFRKFFDKMVRKSTGVPALQAQMKLEQWIDDQKEHEKKFPLTIKGTGLFAPTEELPIRSLPQVEQDVVALFNQMLSSGLVRGMQLLASSQFEQYDGLFRVLMQPPVERYIRSETNPLGVDAELFAGADEIKAAVAVLEYKYCLNALVEDFQTGVKSVNDVKLVVVWEMGERWREDFRILSYLDDDNVHHRQYHGLTHQFFHTTSGLPAFAAVVLSDLVSYLTNAKAETARQKQMYGDTIDLAD
ncbi:ATP-binding protein [Myxococcus sp. K15C18031901]|uniref:ATP-binding protein n=1 Tax=Myxococcus dinghuensis TaxID=2906761 RepID=UPI0020A78865|nr:ATP-binding protein [Myxococcus dinghuensis]MCP3104221.1 ATP-binding protein [Myxococcus dinghuensis]